MQVPQNPQGSSHFTPEQNSKPTELAPEERNELIKIIEALKKINKRMVNSKSVNEYCEDIIKLIKSNKIPTIINRINSLAEMIQASTSDVISKYGEHIKKFVEVFPTNGRLDVEKFNKIPVILDETYNYRLDQQNEGKKTLAEIFQKPHPELRSSEIRVVRGVNGPRQDAQDESPDSSFSSTHSLRIR